MLLINYFFKFKFDYFFNVNIMQTEMKGLFSRARRLVEARILDESSWLSYKNLYRCGRKEKFKSKSGREENTVTNFITF